LNKEIPPAIIFAHGDLGKSLKDAIEGMIGECPHFLAVSNADAGPEDIENRLLEAFNKYKNCRNVFLFVDLFGSSCWKTAKLLAMKNRNVRIITGVNLPMLLSFFTKRDRFEPAELELEVRSAGKRGIEGK
jgi:PTS system mannose-specific IIA component